MIVYVESNFILEITLGQEQALAANQILTMAENREIQLVLPAFGLSEPFSRIRQLARDRQRLQQAMRPIELELRRMHHTRSLADAFRPVREAMLSLERTELDRLEATIERVINSAITIELNTEIYREALQHRNEIDLELEDSIIFSCVLANLRSQNQETPKCFVSKDAKAFFDPGIESNLADHNCRYISKFPQAISYIRSIL